MKKHFKLLSVLAVSSMLSACANFDLGTILKPQRNQQVIQTIPDGFTGKWINKKKPSYQYCNPSSGDFEQVIWIITPQQNHLELLTWASYKVLKFNSLTENAFNAQVEVTSQDIDPDTTSNVTQETLNAKLVNKNTLLIDGKRYYRCP
ncbi:hypothetical protein CT138_06835 [Mannheimia varigena]|uniref:hypothetical protein n=1 Tax=Mannheimia TaxID=75984 RepID=UPI000DBF3835|nr:hypothetical protein [Mannheimia varigena]AWW34582.1 hypothetical protein CT138_06835 [Mannheimia varigena]